MKNLKRYENFLNENFSSEQKMMELQRYYGYYNMANALDIKKTAIPELEKYNIHFEYDSYANLLNIQANEDQVQIVHKILTEIAQAPKSDGSHGEAEGDGAVVRPLNNY
jgi:hypothetical protein